MWKRKDDGYRAVVIHQGNEIKIQFILNNANLQGWLASIWNGPDEFLKGEIPISHSGQLAMSCSTINKEYVDYMIREMNPDRTKEGFDKVDNQRRTNLDINLSDQENFLQAELRCLVRALDLLADEGVMQVFKPTEQRPFQNLQPQEAGLILGGFCDDHRYWTELQKKLGVTEMMTMGPDPIPILHPYSEIGLIGYLIGLDAIKQFTQEVPKIEVGNDYCRRKARNLGALVDHFISESTGELKQKVRELSWMIRETGDEYDGTPEAFVEAMAEQLKKKPRKRSLEDALKKEFEQSWQDILSVIDQATKAHLITTSTYSGSIGGGVGRFYDSEGNSYVFKISTDPIDAYKSATVPAMVHAIKERGIWEQRLARRVPKPVFDEPVEHAGFYITITEDVSNKQVLVDPEEYEILGRQNVSPKMAQILYTTALYHELLSEGFQADPRLKHPTVPTNLHKGLIIERWGRTGKLKKHEKELKKMLEGYEDRTAQLSEIETHGNVGTHGDNKDENYFNQFMLDTGFARLGSEVDDLARPIMNRPSFVNERMKDYLKCYVNLRRAINRDYAPMPEMQELIRMQAGIDALRNAGPAMDEKKFNLYMQVADSTLKPKRNRLIRSIAGLF